MAHSQPATTVAQRFMGCLLGGALGDALGAPVEGLRKLDDVRRKFGATGITQMMPYACPWETVTHTGIGAITDDTTMHASTIAAMISSHSRPQLLHRYAHQAYLRWGVMQEDGLRLLPHIDLTADWPRELSPFWFACGAGRGTIAALATGRRGTPEDPLGYDTAIRGKRVTGPNKGCGGMMRAAALAFWPHAEDKFRLGMENAAITHGAADAWLPTGFVTALVGQMVQGTPLPAAFNTCARRLRQEAGHEATLAACIAGMQQGKQTVPSLDAIDALPATLGYSNPFLAVPVMAQTLYALSARHYHGLGTKETLTLSASHSGDSDSVAAIVGNVIGAGQGAEALPQDWLAQLQLRPQLEALGRRAIQRLSLQP